MQYGMPVGEAVAIGAITRNQWKRPISRMLRYMGGTGQLLPRNWRDVLPLVQGVAQGLARLPVYAKPIRRGVKGSDIPPQFIAAHRPGEVVRYAAFTSGGRALDYPIKMRIVGHDGRDISAFADPRYTSQREVLVPAWRLFEIERIGSLAFRVERA